MQVETILQNKGRSVHTVGSTATIAEAVAMLNSRHIGATVVVDNGRVVGIVSERDVVRHLGDDWSALSSRPVSDVMTKDVVTVGRYATVDEVMEAMTQRRIRHLPVVEGGELIGIVTDGDLRRHIDGDLLAQKVDAVMTPRPKTIRPQALAAEALGQMNARQITSLFVIEDARPVGIVRLHDCLQVGVA